MNTPEQSAHNALYALNPPAEDFENLHSEPELSNSVVGQLLQSLGDNIKENLNRSHKVMIVPPRPSERRLVVEAGDTITGVLQKAGIGASEAYNAVDAMEEHYDPRKIKPGTGVKIRFGKSDENGLQFASMEVEVDPTQLVLVSKREGEYEAEFMKRQLVQKFDAKMAEIETSLYGSAARVGIPSAIIAEAIRSYSWNVDFQRQIRTGDHIKVLYEYFETPDGRFVKYGKIIYATLSVGGTDLPIYRYEMRNGDIDYFDPKGRSIRKALMKTPVDGARLSSGYGMRKHPILGYNKMHKGVDFAAPTGTPIYAAGDGVIERRGTFGAYGKYIRIRHNSALKTAYAHLHKYAKGVAVGKRVKQGDVIGYVGSTGRSTGPHLHYEVIENGRQVNPRKVDLPTGEILKGNELKRFKSKKINLDQQYAALFEDGTRYAQIEVTSD